MDPPIRTGCPISCKAARAEIMPSTLSMRSSNLRAPAYCVWRAFKQQHSLQAG